MDARTQPASSPSSGGHDDVPDPVVVEKARRHLNLSSTDLYVRYFSVSGAASHAEVDEYLAGVGPAIEPGEHNKLILALNECFLERGLPDRLPFLEP